jgi:hypothetical protein
MLPNHESMRDEIRQLLEALVAGERSDLTARLRGRELIAAAARLGQE